MRRLSGFTLSVALLMAAPALAQTTPSPGPGLSPAAPTGPGAAPSGSVGSTVTGAAPAKTGATTDVGQTKPPGDAVGDRLGTRPDLESKSRELDQKIDKGICSGCK